MKSRYVSKIIDVFQRTHSCLEEMKRKKRTEISSHYFSFFALSNYLTPVYISTRQGSSSTEQDKCIFIIYYYICLLLCAHILYFDAAKFSIKLFSLVYVSVSVVRQRDEYEIVTETRPISRC